MMQLPHKSDHVAIPSGGFESTAELIGSIVFIDNRMKRRCQTTSDKVSNRSLLLRTIIKDKVSIGIW